jgi:hypothetical protein
MRCPGCLEVWPVQVNHDTIRGLLKKARIGREAVMKKLDRDIKKNMENYASVFVTALQKEHIFPSDFGQPTDGEVLRTQKQYLRVCEELLKTMAAGSTKKEKSTEGLTRPVG